MKRQNTNTNTYGIHMNDNTSIISNTTNSNKSYSTLSKYSILIFFIVLIMVFISYLGLYHSDMEDNSHMKQYHRRISVGEQQLQQLELIDKLQQQQLKVLNPTSVKELESSSLNSEPIMHEIERLFQLGVNNPHELLQILTTQDVFGTHIENPKDFTCPTSLDQRLPWNVNMTALENFRLDKPNTFIFYQHLRKAGGTSFCDLATHNLPKSQVPGYYCMPDNRGSLATPPWSDSNFLLSNIQKKDHRIVANEWDVFYKSFLSLDNAIFVTTFRHPIDRWFSQFRFEHLEHRDGSAPDVPRLDFMKWYNSQKDWTMGENYYVSTFIGDHDTVIPSNTKGDFYWTYHKYKKIPLTWRKFHNAIETLSQFSLILVLEWLSSPLTEELIANELGWVHPSKQVLPHEVQAIRADKKSKRAQDSMKDDEYQLISIENIFDIFLFDIAKRMYLERIHCNYRR